MTKERRLGQGKIMEGAYPSLELVSADTDDTLIWKGELQPIRSTDELDSLLDDLEHDRDVDIIRGRDCQLAHNLECPEEHGKHRLTEQIVEPIRLFTVRIEDFGDGRMPDASVIEPFIPIEERRHHRGQDGICSFAPFEHPWAKNDSMVEFTDQVLIWLLKQTVYSQTKEWLGRETRHDTPYLFNTIKAYDQCCCGSGKYYADCHRIVHGNELFGEGWLFFEVWWVKWARNLHRFEAPISHFPALHPRQSAKAAGL